jgi:hypothetical protein
MDPGEGGGGSGEGDVKDKDAVVHTNAPDFAFVDEVRP